ncbi:MAG TPA: hypothetical protein VI356_07380 [Myxococcales bacterium]
MAVAVKVTGVPGAISMEQVPGHAIPAGDDVTTPDPVPTGSTVSVTVPAANVAPTWRSESSVRSQPPVPEHAPLQPMNCMPPAGVASRWTAVPFASGWEQLVVQLTDPSGDVTEPCPLMAMLSDASFRPVLAAPDDLPPQAQIAASIPIQPSVQMFILFSPSRCRTLGCSINRATGRNVLSGMRNRLRRRAIAFASNCVDPGRHRARNPARASALAAPGNPLNVGCDTGFCQFVLVAARRLLYPGATTPETHR